MKKQTDDLNPWWLLVALLVALKLVDLISDNVSR